jgi:Sulfotransferase family
MIDTQLLVDNASERAESDDFGFDTWQEGLQVLVGSLAAEGHLNELGEAVFSDQIVGFLVNRLQVERWYRNHPEIEDQEIVAPLFGLGLPRTGSTALSSLFACDRSRRFLRTWEADAPCPPPETATEASDPRIARCQAGIGMTHELFPDFVGMLPSSATGPQECLLLMALDFRSAVFGGMALLPSYTSWLRSCDMVPAYRYHKRVLKLLQWHCPPTRWWLKSPAHMMSIGALDSVYPDARFVMSHREITSVLPSVCALKAALSTPLTHSLDQSALGEHEQLLWRGALEDLIEFRDGGREDRFFDVSFAALQSEPIGAMETLYRQLGDDLPADTRGQMAGWWQENSADRPQGRRPDPADFGLDSATLRQEFSFYDSRFVHNDDA